MQKYKELKPLIKQRAKTVKVLRMKSWIAQNFVEYTILEKHKLYRHKQISGDIEVINMGKDYTFHEVRELYDKYVADCEILKKIDSEYKLFSKGYQCTTNSWYDVDSLGVTIHPETDGIYSGYFNGKTAAEARHKYKIDTESDFIDIKARRYVANDLYLLINPAIYFPILKHLDEKDIETMLHATGNKLGEPIRTFRNRFDAHHNVSCEFLHTIGLMQRQVIQGRNNYFVTSLGLKLIAALLPTNVKQFHYSEIIRNFENNLKTITKKS